MKKSAQRKGTRLTGKPIPNEVKAKRGTLRSDRLGDSSLRVSLTQGVLPDAPKELGLQGSALWTTVLTEASAWVSYKVDTQLLRIVCEQLDERESLKELVRENPEQPRLRSALRELEKAIQSNLSTLGLTPSDRARLGFVMVKQENKLEELIRRRDERASQFRSLDVKQ
jgi:phage terminase small subunit